MPGVVIEMMAVATPFLSISSTARCGDQPNQVGTMRPPPWAMICGFTSSNQNGGTMWWWTSISFAARGPACPSTAGAAMAVAPRAAAVAMNCRRDGPRERGPQYGPQPQNLLCRAKPRPLRLVIGSSPVPPALSPNGNDDTLQHVSLESITGGHGCLCFVV